MKKITAASCLLVFSFILSVATANSADSLADGFGAPPASARPQIWWHWMNGNVTKAGITADLEAMQRVGIGGAQIFNAGEGIPAGPVKFNSAEWHEMFKFAGQEANRLGLELCLHNCAGWSSSGGPWNTPEHSMQRVTISETNVAGAQKFSGTLAQPPTRWNFYRDIAVLAFRTPDNGGWRIQNISAKDGDNGNFVLSSPATEAAPENAVVKRTEMIDLTSRMDANGHLDWDAPAGNWTILRIGYTPKGQENHPAPPEGTGPECDKFSPAALDAHWAGFVQKAIDDLGPLAGKGKTFNNVLIDSYEVGGQNWSANFRAEFQKRRGYDPVPFLPTFTGRVVDNPEISERFLWDVRRTIADLFAENYYGHFKELCDAHNMTASIEPYTGPYESLQAGAAAEIPMGEFWVGDSPPNSSVKLASSVGHIYGRNVIGAESFTAAPGAHGRWLDDPFALKAIGDQVFCEGINRYIFHRYALQPWTNRWPGMTMGQWGTHFDRTSTWWEQSRAWLDYVARCQFMLQQGRFVADAAYFCGESAPAEMRAGNPALPPGYDFDAVGADVLQNATVENGQLVLASGMKYRVLILPPSDRATTPKLLEKIHSLVADGLTLVGAPPENSPSLQDFPRCDTQVKSLAAELWGDCDGKTVTEHAFGKGKVIWGQTLAQVFGQLAVPPDFTFSSTNRAKLSFIHRQAGDAEIYFVSNQRGHFDAADCAFRVSGKVPELWHADTGVRERAPIWREENGGTVVPLTFDPAGSVFVVFRQASRDDHPVAATVEGFLPAEKSIPPPELIIHRATYGVAAKAQSAATEAPLTHAVDLTQKLSDLIEAGGLSVQVDNNLAGGDPLFGQVKELRVDYSLDGVRQTTTVAENSWLNLGQASQFGIPPAFALRADASGKIFVQATSPGKIELTTAAGKKWQAKLKQTPPPLEISGAWDLSFPPNWGAPPQVTLPKLMSWTESTDSGVKYFSGTATYTKVIEIPAAALGKHHALWLDLGRVKNLAEVTLNGKPLGILWKPPFRVDITGAAQRGKNKLEIKVTNLWPNRLIGDEQLPPDCEWDGKHLKAWPQWLLDNQPSPTGRLTFTTWHHWNKDDALLESGLLGPVQIFRVSETPVD
jgi:hypothetical protein